MSQGNLLGNNESISAIDWELCLKLANNKSEIAEEILSFVLLQLPDDLSDIKQAFAKTDYAELLRSVHKLHGALCYTGMPKLKNIVSEFEGYLKKKEFETATIQQMMTHLETATQEVLSAERKA
ncbi:MAG TPA: Hpt domain-containing protein [Gammaproteobacteria bacterium]|nr:Hpt domain-containing protein [Gammaproteobacteria bacterium]